MGLVGMCSILKNTLGTHHLRPPTAAQGTHPIVISVVLKLLSSFPSVNSFKNVQTIQQTAAQSVVGNKEYEKLKN